MEEKERYEYYLGTNSIKDNKTNQIYDYVVDLLNQQSKRIKELEQENQQLKQQLAEKDAEIRVVYSFRKQKCDNLQKALAEKERQVKKLNLEAQKYFEDAYCNDYIYQDKISFCIEKFQETKKSLRDKVCLMGNDTHCYLQNAIHWQDVVAIIDNQIASLKKEMK